MRDDVIKQAIAHRCADGDDAGQIADAVTGALGLLHTELSLLVGAQAATALGVHALHRTRSKIEWTMPRATALSDQTLVELRQDLAARTPIDSLYAGETLLRALVDHLILLIGEPLTHRMLHTAWNTPDATQISQENP